MFRKFMFEKGHSQTKKITVFDLVLIFVYGFNVFKDVVSPRLVSVIFLY